MALRTAEKRNHQLRNEAVLNLKAVIVIRYRTRSPWLQLVLSWLVNV
ncbi:MAG: hypothetical protein NTX48_04650 [Planctomycetales bacterium]|nr:hypothetical protein [Planctomycetales bacterium]